MLNRLMAAANLAYEALRFSSSERAFRRPRLWSNAVLRQVCLKFGGSVLNASGWKDEDKEGGYYKSYFPNSTSYSISNFKYSQGGMQGFDNEIFIDLSAPIEPHLNRKFDVVLCHTVLEHVYDFHSAVKGLCDLSNDIVILVVPWLQEMHSDYGDYWRFSPSAIEMLFRGNGFHALYLDWNDNAATSVYVVAVLSRNADHWSEAFLDLSGRELRGDGVLPDPPPGTTALRGLNEKY